MLWPDFCRNAHVLVKEITGVGGSRTEGAKALLMFQTHCGAHVRTFVLWIGNSLTPERSTYQIASGKQEKFGVK